MLRALQAAGFDVLRSAEFLPSGDDESVLALAFREGRVLLTEDTDFGKLTVQLGTPTKGMVRIVLKTMDKEARNVRAASALFSLGDRVWNAITVIEPGRVRIRPLSNKA